MITYGDGVADINIREMINFHHAHGKILTISTTRPEGRFGAISIDKDGNEMLERGPFDRLMADKQIAAYWHLGFWSPMDNIHDREYLDGLWGEGEPWKMWWIYN